jgi:hypothetical protein
MEYWGVRKRQQQKESGARRCIGLTHVPTWKAVVKLVASGEPAITTYLPPVPPGSWILAPGSIVGRSRR